MLEKDVERLRKAFFKAKKEITAPSKEKCKPGYVAGYLDGYSELFVTVMLELSVLSDELKANPDAQAKRINQLETLVCRGVCNFAQPCGNCEQCQKTKELIEKR